VEGAGNHPVNCAACQGELPNGASFCPHCGARVGGTLGAQVDRIADETERAAKEFADAAVRFADRSMDRAERAAKDPPAAARKALERSSEELDKARKKIQQALHDLRS
jgi:hypothetical protein